MKRSIVVKKWAKILLPSSNLRPSKIQIQLNTIKQSRGRSNKICQILKAEMLIHKKMAVLSRNLLRLTLSTFQICFAIWKRTIFPCIWDLITSDFLLVPTTRIPKFSISPNKEVTFKIRIKITCNKLVLSQIEDQWHKKEAIDLEMWKEFS